LGIGETLYLNGVLTTCVLDEEGKPTLTTTSEPTATPCPAETSVPTEPDVGVTEEETVEPIWSDPDAFDSRDTEYPLGDAQSWTYFQSWNGSDLNTVLHVAVAPGVVVVVREYVGTRYQVWNGPDMARWEEMRNECEVRDQLPSTPPLVIIESTEDTDVGILPANWSVISFPA
jgi:hypothetical protein